MKTRKTAVVTGASSGIGLALSELLAEKGFSVYGISRSGKSGNGVVGIKADVSDEESVKNAFEMIGREAGKIDVLVCNAGFGISGAMEFTELPEAKRLFDVNFFGAFLCAKHAMRYLKEARGKILCTSSAAAVFSIPFQLFYSASKAAVNSLCTALSNEVSRFGVQVSALMLGDARTGFTDARLKEHEGDDIYGGSISRSVAVMENDEKGGMSPRSIARFMYRVAEKKRIKPLYTVGAKYKLFVFLSKLLPASIVTKVIGIMYVK